MIVKFFSETIYRNPSITISLEACSSKPNSKLPRHEMQIEPLSPLLLLLSLVSQFELYIGPRDARANRSSRGHQSSTANEPPPPLLSSAHILKLPYVVHWQCSHIWRTKQQYARGQYAWTQRARCHSGWISVSSALFPKGIKK